MSKIDETYAATDKLQILIEIDKRTSVLWFANRNAIQNSDIKVQDITAQFVLLGLVAINASQDTTL